MTYLTSGNAFYKHWRNYAGFKNFQCFFLAPAIKRTAEVHLIVVGENQKEILCQRCTDSQLQYSSALLISCMEIWIYCPRHQNKEQIRDLT